MARPLAVTKRSECAAIGGSRFSRCGRINPVGGANAQCGRFLAKMYAQRKELDAIGSGSCVGGSQNPSLPAAYLPFAATIYAIEYQNKISHFRKTKCSL